MDEKVLHRDRGPVPLILLALPSAPSTTPCARPLKIHTGAELHLMQWMFSLCPGSLSRHTYLLFSHPLGSPGLLSFLGGILLPTNSCIIICLINLGREVKVESRVNRRDLLLPTNAVWSSNLLWEEHDFCRFLISSVYHIGPLLKFSLQREQLDPQRRKQADPLWTARDFSWHKFKSGS